MHWVPTPYMAHCQVQRREVKGPRSGGGQTHIQPRVELDVSENISQIHAHEFDGWSEGGRERLERLQKGIPEPSLWAWLGDDQKEKVKGFPSRRKACEWEASWFGMSLLVARLCWRVCPRKLWVAGDHGAGLHKPHNLPFRTRTLVFRWQGAIEGFYAGSYWVQICILAQLLWQWKENALLID